MKSANIFLLSFILLLSGCSLYERFIDNNMYIANAGFKDFRKAPIKGDVPETGTDLAVIVKNWPDDAEPSFIVFDRRKSYKANISDRIEDGVVINARVLVASSVMKETSEEVDKSSRLVYTDAEGKEKYLEIEKWTRIEE